MERTQTLQRVSDEIEQIKEQIDEQGQRNSDGGELFCGSFLCIMIVVRVDLCRDLSIFSA